MADMPGAVSVPEDGRLNPVKYRGEDLLLQAN